MREFKAGRDITVGRDLNIIDKSNQPYKPLAQCTNEELYPARQHRKKKLSEEIRSKGKCVAFMWLGAEILVCGTALWFYTHGIQGVPEIPFLILSIGSLFVGGGAVFKFFEYQSPLEQSLRADLQEIKIILGKRGVK
jgi:hypothetical protein